MSLIPNVSSNTFTLSAIVVGLLLLDDTTPNEQNALGNWLMLVAQILCTDAYYKQVLEDRNNIDDKELLQKMASALNKGLDNFGK
jgi:hypothetical protein